MNPEEQQLQDQLKQDPGNWELRFALAESYYSGGDYAAAARTVSEAPASPDTEEAVLKAVRYLADADETSALALAHDFLKENSGSSEVTMAAARLLAHGGQPEEAARHYRRAASIDPDLRDKKFEQWFESSGIKFEDEGGAEIAEAKAEPDVQPIAPAKISSLKDRRGSGGDEKGKGEKKSAVPPPTAASVPPPSLAVQRDGPGEGVAQVVDHYAVEDLHAADHAELAPPPAIHATHDEAQVAQREAMERTGLVTVGEGLTMGNIRQLQKGRKDTKEKVSAMAVAVLVHVLVFFVLGLIVIAVPRALPPQIVALASPSDEVVPELEKKEVQKVTKPNPSTMSKVNVLTVANSSAVAVPVMLDPVDTLEPIGMSDDFGMAMNFGAQGAGNVSFFGSKAVANKVVIVVDSSASMNSKGKTGLSKHELMKEELKKTIKGLSSGVQFQILFFSGPCWFVGEEVPSSRDKNDDWHEWEGKNFWHFKDGDPEELPVGKYRNATPGTVRKTMREIDETPATYGTDWRAPLQMAMMMEPDVIYFMTDGAVGKHPAKPPVVEDVIKFNRRKSGAKINSICLMVPQATEMLRQLAEDSRGEFTLVLEDGTPLRGKELEDYEKEFGKKKK